MEHRYVVWYRLDEGWITAFRCTARDKRQAKKRLYDYWKFFGNHSRDEIVITDVERED